MRNNIIFALLVAVFAAAGIAGSELMFRSSDKADTGEEAVRRSSFRTGAVYIAADDELELDPMSQLDRNIWIAISDSSTDQSFIGDCPYSKLMMIMLRHLSRYSEYTTIDTIISEPKIMRTSNRSDYCVQGLRYTNPAGEVLTADLIITNYLEVKYVRFYEDMSYDLTPDEIQLGAERLNDMTEQLFDSFRNYYELQEDGEYYDVSEPWNSTPYIEIELSNAVDVADLIDTALWDIGIDTAFDSKLMESATPIERFLRHTGAMSSIELTELDPDYYGSYKMWANIISTSTISSYISNSYGAAPRYSSELVASDGRIYDTLRISDNYYIINVVFIYNVERNVIEGVYTASDPTIW